MIVSLEGIILPSHCWMWFRSKM